MFLRIGGLESDGVRWICFCSLLIDPLERGGAGATRPSPLLRLGVDEEVQLLTARETDIY